MVTMSAIIMYPLNGVNAKIFALSGSNFIRSIFLSAILENPFRYPPIAMIRLTAYTIITVSVERGAIQKAPLVQRMPPAIVQRMPANAKR